jgi:hypothetical protein
METKLNKFEIVYTKMGFGQTKSMEVEKMNSNNSQGVKGETCIVCDTERTKGIHVYTSFICVDCEKEIINTGTSDPNYQYYLEKLRRIKNPPLYS